MKRVAYTAGAAKDLRNYRHIAARIVKTVREYADGGGAQANAVEKLTGSRARRLRVGDFRVIFEEDPALITVTKIGPRGSVYE